MYDMYVYNICDGIRMGYKPIYDLDGVDISKINIQKP